MYQLIDRVTLSPAYRSAMLFSRTKDIAMLLMLSETFTFIWLLICLQSKVARKSQSVTRIYPIISVLDIKTFHVWGPDPQWLSFAYRWCHLSQPQRNFWSKQHLMLHFLVQTDSNVVALRGTRNKGSPWARPRLVKIAFIKWRGKYNQKSWC